jgi:hypothetical protein
MGIAFFTYGLVFGTCAVMTGYFARKREFRRHKNWAIRSYSQILASMLYRYFYAVLGGFQAVHFDPEEILNCDEMDVCDYFLKPFDAIHAWTFFIVPLLFAEAVIYLLRDQSKEQPTDGMHLSQEGEESCKHEEEESPGEQMNNNDNADQTKPESEVIDKSKAEASPTNKSAPQTNFIYLNSFGALFALIFLGSTVFIYVTSALGINTFSV